MEPITLQEIANKSDLSEQVIIKELERVESFDNLVKNGFAKIKITDEGKQIKLFDELWVNSIIKNLKVNNLETNSRSEIIEDILSFSKKEGLIQITTEDKFYKGNNITINSKSVMNLGSCSYLGLELDQRLKEGAIKAINDYGIQFSSSRSYLSCSLYNELEELLFKMFKNPIVVTPTTTLGHHSVIPIVIKNNDIMIIDQLAHASIQDVALKMKGKGVTVVLNRHNDMVDLEKKIIKYSSKYNNVWFFADGVYSMYGDKCPIHELNKLLNKHEKFHLYVDDAHGMSVYGENGTGYILSECKLHPKMILGVSLAKGFGAGGGCFVFPNIEIASKVRMLGGSLMFSGPIQVPVLGGAIKSAEIHLSSEIYRRQENVFIKVGFLYNLLVNKYDLPIISDSNSPIFFLGLGKLESGYKVVKKMLKEGYYTNISVFPAVPISCTGVRFTITIHHSFNDLENFANKLSEHFYKTLSEENFSLEKIYHAFRKTSKNMMEC